MIDRPFPTAYSTPGYVPAVPGADWFIEGVRFHEHGRERVGDREFIKLVPAT